MDGYLPISDYAAIGNLRTVALVGRSGSIDWCCLPSLGRPSVFAALLDARRGGRFRVRALGVREGAQHYLEDTNVLATEFRDGAARLTVTDLMPLRGEIEGRGGSEAPPEILRILDCSGSDIDVAVEWSPRFDYSRAVTVIEEAPGGWRATGGKETLCLSGVAGAAVRDEGSGPGLHARFTMRDGERRVLVCRWGTGGAAHGRGDVEALLERTVHIWREWARREEAVQTPRWAGEHLPLVTRSELALKLLTSADTGAIAAAPTTSVPEEIGGVRNWDYRYAWIRDASMTAQALISLGHEREALDFLLWMEQTSEEHFQEMRPQILYGLHGEEDLAEQEFSHLEGYRGSRPVRIGNAAAKQLQLEVFGELISTAYELARRGVGLGEGTLDFIAGVADYACSIWKEPDHGIWEVRTRPQQFVYSKVMIWVALDRALYLAKHHDLAGDTARWRATCRAVRDAVLEQGYDGEIGAFVQAFGSKALDAANLRLPLVEFLPCEDDRVQGTIDRTLDRLCENGLVYRYRTADGLPGGEGAFGICTFWLIDALCISGRVGEARRIFDGIAGRANHVGLLPEQFDPVDGAFLGNFPQAFSHIGLVNSALYLAYAEGRWVPEHAPIGFPGEGIR
ncbi:glycoside hydrolase family 15 protein [Methanoculleus sp. FWC-SCC1]|uniref:Glycoside hydrolase family 15 protein n=1 Tax=Methanoculleus frigidifontis TaxID=2584085 RepID=A0ABT8M9K7_9EURY|nr:glycoside hydrolase family 15 protein [Methanoculleus sp. FWC-SCC1]MDN7024626.1 glycoside hydrolase family 15 protein [Methanoculleus sp. FWC-SCC1]